MSELLTEKSADTVEPVDTATVESTTTEANEHGETHMADGALLEEMNKAVKQSAFAFFFGFQKRSLALLTCFFVASLSKKKLSFISLMPTFLTTGAPIF